MRGERVAGHNSNVAPTVSRRAERSVGSQTIAKLSRAQGGVVIVEGAAGIGKTHLLQLWCEEATAAGLLVLRGAGLELERDRAFGVVTDALALRRRLPGDDQGVLDAAVGSPSITEVTARDAVADRRHLVLESIADLLEELATSQPIALIVDDLQWSDDASLMTLARVASLTRVLPIALIAALRTTPRSESLAALLRAATAHDARFVTVGPLDAAAAEELVTLLAGEAPGPRLVAMAEKCAGNPLFLRELVDALRREQMLESGQGHVDLVASADPAAPPALTMLILRHLSVLPPATLDLMRIASVLGSVFSVADLGAVTARPASGLLETLSPARAAGLLVDSGSGLAFQHDLIREALYEDLGTSLRRALHRQVADALMDRGAALGRIAVHVAAGAEPGDTAAARVLYRAGCDAAARDPVSAASFLKQAVALAGPANAILADIELKLAYALAAAGQFAEADEVLHRLIDRVPEGRMRTLSRTVLAQVLYSRGHYDEMREVSDELLDSPFLTPIERARVFASLVNRRVWNGEGSTLQDDAADALVLGVQLHDAATQYWALSAQSALARYAGRMSEARDIALESARVLGDSDRAAASGDAVEPPLVGPLIVADCFDEATALLDTPAWRGERGIYTETHRQRHTMMCDLHRGRWDDAAAAGETALALGGESGAPQVIQGYVEPILALISARCGDIAHASRLLARPMFPVPEEIYVLTFANAYVDAAAGNKERARELAASLVGRRNGESHATAAAGVWTQTWRDFGALLVQLLITLGRVDAARAVVVDLEAMAERAAVASVTGIALFGRALVNNDPEGLLAAVDVLRRTPRVVDLALASEEAGAATRSAQLLAEALELYERFGARSDAARTRSRMRACGIRPGPRGRRMRPTTGYGSLTPTERRVAELVVHGLLYKEIAERLFVSRRTVETHVVHLFAKLGVGSRLELTRTYRELERQREPGRAN